MEVRGAAEDELEQIVSLQVERNGPECDAMVRALWVDPACGNRRFTVAVEDARVVSSLCLIAGTLEVAGVVVPYGQPEFVATAPSHEHRGLVRRQLDLVHRWSLEDGHLTQLIAGIPYFYRRFGYEYAIGMPPLRLVLPTVDLTMPDGWSVRPAQADDIPIIMELEQDVQRLSELRARRRESWWRWWIEGGEQPVPHVAERGGVIEASASFGEGPPGLGQDVVVLSLVDELAVDVLLDLLIPVRVGDRRGAT